MSNFIHFFKRETQLSFAQPNNFLLPLIFFISMILLFNFAFGADILNEQPHIYKSITILLIFFSIMLNFERIFLHDYHDGTITILKSLQKEENYFLSKVVSFWVLNVLPIILLSIFTIADNFLDSVSKIILVSIITTFLTCFIALITLQSSINNLLFVILLFPFEVPILILSVLDIDKNYLNITISPLYLLFGFTLLILSLTILLGNYFLKNLE